MWMKPRDGENFIRLRDEMEHEIEWRERRISEEQEEVDRIKRALANSNRDWLMQIDVGGWPYEKPLEEESGSIINLGGKEHIVIQVADGPYVLGIGEWNRRFVLRHRWGEKAIQVMPVPDDTAREEMQHESG